MSAKKPFKSKDGNWCNGFPQLLSFIGGTVVSHLPEMKRGQRGIVTALEHDPDYYQTPAKIPYIVFRHLGVSPSQLYETGEVDMAFS